MTDDYLWHCEQTTLYQFLETWTHSSTIICATLDSFTQVPRGERLGNTFPPEPSMVFVFFIHRQNFCTNLNDWRFIAWKWIKLESSVAWIQIVSTIAWIQLSRTIMFFAAIKCVAWLSLAPQNAFQVNTEVEINFAILWWWLRQCCFCCSWNVRNQII